MIEELNNPEKETDQRLLRHIIKCYLRLSENNRANEALKKCLPDVLKSNNVSFIQDDNVRRWHLQLLQNLEILQRDNSNFPHGHDGINDGQGMTN